MMASTSYDSEAANIMPPLHAFPWPQTQTVVGKSFAFGDFQLYAKRVRLPRLFTRRNRVDSPRASLDVPSSSTQPNSEIIASSIPTPGSSGSDSSNYSVQRSQRSTHIPAGIGIGLGGGASLASPSISKAVGVWSQDSKARTNDGQRTVVIMMSNTGGGHKASAEALASAFKELYGNKFKVHIVDMWKEHTPAPFSSMPDSYSFLVKHAFLWRLSYEMSNPKFIHIPYFQLISLFIAKGVGEAFEMYQPDLVVSVHPLMQHIPLAVLKQLVKQGRCKNVKFATVVTDFTTCHNTWFHRNVSKCFVPTEFCRDLAKRNGLKDEQIVLHGLPIRPVFCKRLPGKKAMKKKLGLDQKLPAVLLVGGGEGMGKLQETVDQLDAQVGAECQVVVVCGRNRQLLDALNSRSSPSGMKVTAVGFVDNMHEWMAAVDMIVTKAGPGTIAEALITGLPILLNGNVPCQEEGNIPFVMENGVGAFETKPEAIAEIVKEWLGPEKEVFEAMADKAKSLGRPEAVYNIVKDLATLCDDVPTLTSQVSQALSPASLTSGLMAMPSLS